MSVSGRETLPNVWEWSEGAPRCLGVVGRPSEICGSGRGPSRMFGSGREALSEVREWSRVPPESLVVVGRPSGICGSGREALLDVWE